MVAVARCYATAADVGLQTMAAAFRGGIGGVGARLRNGNRLAACACRRGCTESQVISWPHPAQEG